MLQATDSQCAANPSALDKYYTEPAFAALTATHNDNQICYEIELRQLERHMCDSYGYNYYSVAHQRCAQCACIRSELDVAMHAMPRLPCLQQAALCASCACIHSELDVA